METEERKDRFIRDLIRQQPQEKAPEGFTDTVMGKIRAAGESEHEPILSPMTWFAIFLGAAAVVATMLFLDIPVINDIFSSSGIQKLSFNIFSKPFYESFVSIFKGIHIDHTALVIIGAVLSLFIIERVLAARRSSQGLMIL